MERKRVLFPAFTGHPGVEKLFTDAGFIVDYALSEHERSFGRWAYERAADREKMLEEAFKEKLPQANILCGNGIITHHPVTAELLGQAKKLECIFIGAAGFDKIDVKAANERGVVVFNAPGGNAKGVAEHALGLMLSLSRRIDATARYSRRTKKWAREFAMTSSPKMTLLHGKTLGLLGYGFIGRHLADRCRLGLGMNVIAYDPYFDHLEAERQGVRLVPLLEDVLKEADFLSLHMPLNEKTRGIIGARELGMMKPTAYIINTARGGSIDTNALVEALKANKIAGAGLDCVDPEPLPDGHPLFDLENAVITPHIGGGTPEDIENSAIVAARLAIGFIQGAGARHAVNPEGFKKYAERPGTPYSNAGR